MVVILTIILKWREISLSSNSINLISSVYPPPEESDEFNPLLPHPLPEGTSTTHVPTQRTGQKFIGPDCLIDSTNNIALDLKKGWYGFIPRVETASIDIFNYDPDKIEYSHGKPLNLLV